MAIPNCEELLPIVLTYATKERCEQDAVRHVSEQFGLTEEEKTQRLTPEKNTIVANNVAWTIEYLTLAGLIDRKTSGFFIISEAGQSVVSKDLHKLDFAFLSRFFRNRN